MLTPAAGLPRRSLDMGGVPFNRCVAISIRKAERAGAEAIFTKFTFG
jgi:hypothetical protein